MRARALFVAVAVGIAVVAAALLAPLLYFSLSPAPSTAPAQPTPSTAPPAWTGTTNSLNWAGYAVAGPAGSVSDVRGSWIVPTIQGTCPSTNQYASFWVGIDGFNSNTVEQTGTDSDCRNGVPTYYAWYEFYPKPSRVVSGMAVHPGDVMSAEVLYAGGTFKVTMLDATTGGSFSASAHVNSAQRSSAEWIAEAPSSAGGILPLADFGTVSFGADSTGVAATCTATVGGVSGPIGSFGTSVVSITMVTSSGVTKASPSALSTDGTSFSVTWKSAGP